MQEQSLFIEALEKEDPAERAAFLDQACAGDPALRQRLDRLLHRHAQADSFLESPASAEAPISERPGTIIGAYRLREQIGEGGMGLVFVAEQQQPVRRKVALKVIKPGMDSREVIARFEAERQALALMDHPHIAQVHDAGTTETGRPYFVMELVKGVPITQYCDDHRLTPRQRLELFVNVCQAVQHAHQKGVIHRDVKPSNVLVSSHDGTPVVKVIDFGVAKAIGQELTDKTVYTGFSQLLGTPLYMSPEQAGMSGLDIDTRTDLYALGVLLYELLTGTTPFEEARLREASFDEMRRIIREEEPPKPSTRLSTLGQAAVTASDNRRSDPKKLGQLLRGDLDWMVMKCLEKDRNRRYETASALAADVVRYLHDEPVLAGPPTRRYRLRKFVRRHKGKVLAAAAMLVLLLAGTVASTWQAVRATHAERQITAEQEKTQAALTAETAAKTQTREALDALTDDVLERLLAKQPELGDDEKAFLRKVLNFYEAFTRQLGETAEARELRAQGHFKVARLRERLGERPEAVAGYREAAALLEQLVSDSPDEHRYRPLLATCLSNLGLQLWAVGMPAEAETACRRAVALLEPLIAEFPDVSHYREKLSVSCNKQGIVLGRLGKRDEAETAFRKAVALQEKLAAEFPHEPRHRHELAIRLNNLVYTWTGVGKRLDAEVEATCRRALDLHKQVVAEQPAVPVYRHELAISLNNLGNLLRERGNHAEAEPVYRQSLTFLERLADEYPAAPRYRSKLADTYDKLGIVLVNLDRPEDAETACRKALALQQRLAAEFPASPEHRKALADSHYNLGMTFKKRGQGAKQEEAYRRVLDILEKLVAEFPAGATENWRVLALTHRELANLLRDQGKYAEAEEAYRRALDLQNKLADEFPAVPKYRLDLAYSQQNLGILHALQDRPADALPWFDRALALLQALHEHEPRDAAVRKLLGQTHRARAMALDDLKRHTEAQADWEAGLKLLPPADQLWARLARARGWARAGKAAAAVAEAEALMKAPAAPGAALFGAARIYALAVAAVAEDAEMREAYASRALALLRRAQAAGFFKDHKEVERLKKIPDLEPLRAREDFRKFVAELEAAAAKE